MAFRPNKGYKNLQQIMAQYILLGRTACKQGKKLKDNPYKQGSSESQWMAIRMGN